MSIKALQPTTNPFRGLSMAELCRYAKGSTLRVAELELPL